MKARTRPRTPSFDGIAPALQQWRSSTPRRGLVHGVVSTAAATAVPGRSPTRRPPQHQISTTAATASRCIVPRARLRCGGALWPSTAWSHRRHAYVGRLTEAVENEESNLPEPARKAARIMSQIGAPQDRIGGLDRTLRSRAAGSEMARRLRTVPWGGTGDRPLTTSPVPPLRVFGTGRGFADCLGPMRTYPPRRA
jgi:hypothetical protein